MLRKNDQLFRHNGTLLGELFTSERDARIFATGVTADGSAPATSGPSIMGRFIKDRRQPPFLLLLLFHLALLVAVLPVLVLLVLLALLVLRVLLVLLVLVQVGAFSRSIGMLPCVLQNAPKL